MITSAQSSETPLMQAVGIKPVPKWLIYSFIAVSFLGFLDATYLTVEHLIGADINCYIFTGCQTVLTSKWSVVYGIPLAAFGAAFYLAILFTTFLYLDTKKKIFLSFLPLLGTAGFLVSLVLVYTMLFVLDAICTYCVVSALTSTTLFVLGIILFRGRKVLKP